MGNRRRAVRNQRIAFSSILFILLVVMVGFILPGAVKAQAASAETSHKYYTSIQVQKGDTLWTIANSYITEEYSSIHDYIEEVCELNHISDNDIHYGQYLTIPYYSDEYLD